MTVYQQIAEHLADPKAVVAVSTMTRHTIYRPRHLPYFTEPMSAAEKEKGVYYGRGKSRVFIFAYQIRFGRIGSRKETK